ncbi:alpha/beta fold hydrolase [Methylobacterium dankookense]|uniref:2-succinyl-6-hydroxy-2, 4-cyclohexadiene-1-carboxylate synthase n=1 Tax=Methylobacterium dankookense TaxID=560405 RepID=A0A564FUC5_9HYPH|nr:alpha/beta hydrolase [Methylobacterium dankookense]GJD56195.1 2-succinyl-6-hydroxy-2, 4-cyclohexadiene-1-carboxylate synthase [Methylobacterium dankookense]VUF11769.1 Dihydrolipoyllysine-residue acetyltransferase component of acetoin cleaving system [Methylobacterium dankookense]
MQSFDSDGVRIAYIDVAPQGGSGDPILLIHGFASNHAVNWVNTLWVRTLAQAGYRVIALDNRGHGESEKLYDPALYSSEAMAGDAVRLLDHLGIARADVMGYSMGGRITAHLALDHRDRLRSALIGGLGMHLVEGRGLPAGIAEALEAPAGTPAPNPTAAAFRTFAEQTRSDLRALAACMRGSRQTLSRGEIAQIELPVLVTVGTLDTVAGSGPQLAALMPNARALEIPGRDHSTAVGAREHREGVLAFLAARP